MALAIAMPAATEVVLKGHLFYLIFLAYELTYLFSTRLVYSALVVRMIHGDKALKMPNEFEAVVRSEQGVVVAVECTRRQFYGIQYHS
ncbi:hypothetical protein CTI12_AA566750 [Artemisia annua]|uniref:Uncharacterized protein n=1 Tax=Artemisia annua TaxID=35608 RepID=A0A2U1KTC3_ARTAN|nr:hypothetical protein CTI12_AA566750 [Artemisia annua]